MVLHTYYELFTCAFILISFSLNQCALSRLSFLTKKNRSQTAVIGNLITKNGLIAIKMVIEKMLLINGF